MRLLLLSELRSSHTVKWATSLALSGNEVCVVGLTAVDEGPYKGYKSLTVRSLGLSCTSVSDDRTTMSKLRYLGRVSRLRHIVTEFQPDIVHAHYASSYGLLGALSGFRPLIISVWGSDVFEFPRQNRIYRALFKWNLGRAAIVLSTSKVMADETAKYTGKKILVTPFGVDVSVFKPMPKKSHGPLVVGCVKPLEQTYGTEYLIKAFAISKRRLPEHRLQLMLVGGGTKESELRQLAVDQGVGQETIFVGAVPHAQVARYHQQIDISVFPSFSDSFGVSAVEASACGNPVIVSNVGGLPEVVENEVSGIVVPCRDVEAIASALVRLVTNPDLRRQMGTAGRKRVLERYDWRASVESMLQIYRSLIRQNGLSASIC